jgi:hypothetical protein
VQVRANVRVREGETEAAFGSKKALPSSVLEELGFRTAVREGWPDHLRSDQGWKRGGNRRKSLENPFGTHMVEVGRVGAEGFANNS